MFCLSTPHGALDVFRTVRGLSEWQASWTAGVPVRTAAGVECRGLSDRDMLQCQVALPDSERKNERIQTLQRAIEGGDHV